MNTHSELQKGHGEMPKFDPYFLITDALECDQRCPEALDPLFRPITWRQIHLSKEKFRDYGFHHHYGCTYEEFWS